jgi:hypothetical protein
MFPPFGFSIQQFQAYAFFTGEKKEALYVNFGIPPCGKKFSFYCWKIM